MQSDSNPTYFFSLSSFIYLMSAFCSHKNNDYKIQNAKAYIGHIEQRNEKYEWGGEIVTADESCVGCVDIPLFVVLNFDKS